MFRGYRLRNYDFKLIIMLVALSIIGILAVGSAEASLRNKQIFGVVAGIVLMVIVSLFNYKWVLKFYWFMYIANLILLLLVEFLGKEGGYGAQRWLRIGSFQFQPSETAKILLILFFAQFIMKHRERLNSFPMILTCLILVAVPWYLIFDQPDLSTSIMILLIFCIVMFAGGLSWKIIIGILAVTVPIFIILVSIALQPGTEYLEEYQKNRILAFINPEEYSSLEAYQQLNSVTAIASGMLDGKGYNNNEITSVVNGNFVSQPQTDFIFAVVGEEFGFKGCFLVITLITLISLECISIARHSMDLAGKIIASGIGGLVAFQSFINIGVATFILPNTGLPLPFVSYGLTSVMSLFIGMGFVLNIKLHSKR